MAAEMPNFQRSSPAALTRGIYVQRLARLVRLRREFINDLNPLGLDMLDSAIRATYKDCLDFGATEQARRLTENCGLDMSESA